MQTNPGEAQGKCVKRSECSTGLFRVGKSRISTDFCFQTSPDAEVASGVYCRHIPGATQAPVCRHVHGQLRSLCCRHLQERHLLLFSIQVFVVWTCPGATQASGNVYTSNFKTINLVILLLFQIKCGHI